MQKLKSQITPLSVKDKVTLFEYIRDLLHLRTVTDYAKNHGHSYNGVNEGKEINVVSTTVAGKKFIVDNDGE